MPNMDESRHTCKWNMSYKCQQIKSQIYSGHLSHRWLWQATRTKKNKKTSHVIYINTSCSTHEWVISHTWMSHITYKLHLLRVELVNFELARRTLVAAVGDLDDNLAFFLALERQKKLRRSLKSQIYSRVQIVRCSCTQYSCCDTTMVRLIYVCDMSHSCVWHVSFMYVTWHVSFMCLTCVVWLIHIWYVTHTWISHATTRVRRVRRAPTWRNYCRDDTDMSAARTEKSANWQECDNDTSAARNTWRHWQECGVLLCGGYE